MHFPKSLATQITPKLVVIRLKVSRRTDYALRAVFHLVEAYGEGPVSIRQLSDGNQIPKRFLEHIMLDLKSQGWVESVPGKRGGYVLARSPEQITMGQIVRHLEGLLAPLGCVSIAEYERCTQESVCRFRRVFLEARNLVADLMDRSSLAAVFARAVVRPEEVHGFTAGDGI